MTLSPAALGTAVIGMILIQVALLPGLVVTYTWIMWNLGLSERTFPRFDEVTETVYALAVVLQFFGGLCGGYMLVALMAGPERDVRRHLVRVMSSRTAWWLLAWWLLSFANLIALLREPSVPWLFGLAPAMSFVVFWPGTIRLVRLWWINLQEPFFAGFTDEEILRLVPMSPFNYSDAIPVPEKVVRESDAIAYTRLARTMKGNREWLAAFVLLLGTVIFGYCFTALANGDLNRALPWSPVAMVLGFLGLAVRQRAEFYRQRAEEMEARGTELAADAARQHGVVARVHRSWRQTWHGLINFQQARASDAPR